MSTDNDNDTPGPIAPESVDTPKIFYEAVASFKERSQYVIQIAASSQEEAIAKITQELENQVEDLKIEYIKEVSRETPKLILAQASAASNAIN